MKTIHPTRWVARRSAAFTGVCGLLLVGGLLSNSARAADPTTLQMTISPAAAPRPALKYRLQCSFVEQNVGNAASLYSRAIILFKDNSALGEKAMQRRIGELVALPLEKLPKKETREILQQAGSVLHEVRMGTRRTTCDWDLPIREEQNPFTVLLPELQELRNIAHLLALQVRLQIAEKQYDEAIDTLRTGLTLGRHVAETPLLINGLVGITISGEMVSQLRELEQAADAPNLYWAVSALPEHFVDLRAALDTESAFVQLMFPQLRNVEQADRSDAQWQAEWSAYMAKWNGLTPLLAVDGQKDDWRDVAKMVAGKTWIMLSGYPKAKAGLRTFGYDQKAIDAMPPPKAMLLYSRLTYEDLRDEMFRWHYVPFWQAQVGMQAAEQTLKSARDREIIPLATLMLPAIQPVRVTEVRLQRDLAIVRTVEALRLHAAANQSKLPASLDQVTIAPIPIDPFTGKTPPYQLTDGVATLDYPAAQDRPENEHIRVVVKLRTEK